MEIAPMGGGLPLHFSAENEGKGNDEYVGPPQVIVTATPKSLSS